MATVEEKYRFSQTGAGPLTDEQQHLVELLKKDVASIVANNAALQAFCNEHTYVRFLRARQWNLQKAAKMLHATLEWRMQYKPHLIRFDEVKEECVTGKNHIYHAADKYNRPIVLMRPRLENTKTHDRQIRFLIYLLEQASRIADQRGVGKMAWLLDFEGYSLANAPPMSTSIHCNSILQNHYPERLGNAVCWHSPMLFSLTWKAVRPFIDVVTQKKILFADKGAAEKQIMNDMFFMDKMEQCIGGGYEGFAFDLDKFEQECREYDKAVEQELAMLEAKLKDSQVDLTALATEGVEAVEAIKVRA